MLWEEKHESGPAVPFECFDAPRRPDNPAPHFRDKRGVGRKWSLARSNAREIVPLSRFALSLPAAIFVSISTS